MPASSRSGGPFDATGSFRHRISGFFRHRKWDVLLSLGSILLALFVLEMLIRACVYGEWCRIDAIKDPANFSSYYDEDYWYFFYKFDQQFRVEGQGSISVSGSTRFYDDWALSLQPDSLLGYSRRPNVDVPCHETSNLATRSTRDYDTAGTKILFYGDSGTESDACSDNTITVMVERLSGFDTLNFGVGGYGFDQIYLMLERTAHDFEDGGVVVLGMFLDDLDRTLLRARTSVKPYFTVEGDSLRLHTDHIDPDDPSAFFEEYSIGMRSYLGQILMAKVGLSELIHRSEYGEVEATKRRLTALLLDRTLAVRPEMPLYVVVFSNSAELEHGYGANGWVFDLLRDRGVPVVEHRKCLLDHYDGDPPETGLFTPSGHGNPAANLILANCLLDRIEEV